MPEKTRTVLRILNRLKIKTCVISIKIALVEKVPAVFQLLRHWQRKMERF